VAAGGRLGTPWRARRRAARRGTEPGLGIGRRVEEGEAGGGAAAVERRPGGLCAGGRRNRAGQHVPEEEEEREGVRGTCLEIPRILGASLSHPIYKDINRAIIYAPGSSHTYIQQIIKISQHMPGITLI
jgi:hypothetical protein